MNLRIEADPLGKGCKVWLDDHAVSFQNQDDAKAYAAQLQARLDASPEAFERQQPRQSR